MQKVRTRIDADAMRRVQSIAEAVSLRPALVLDAIIQIGLREAESRNRYTITGAGLVITESMGEGANNANGQRQTKPRARRAEKTHLTAATTTTQPPVSKLRASEPQPQVQTTNKQSHITETTSKTQPQVRTLQSQQPLSRDQIPPDVYEDLSDYEKDCLKYEAFVLDPGEGVKLREDPPLDCDGNRATADSWKMVMNTFVNGDDPDFFDRFKW